MADEKKLPSNTPIEIILNFHGPRTKSDNWKNFITRKRKKNRKNMGSVELIEVHKDDFVAHSNPPQLKDEKAIQNKYAALKNASMHTKITLCGHGSDGLLALCSDEDANGLKTGQIQFSVAQVAHLIRFIPPSSSDNQDNKQEPERLKISVLACNGEFFAGNLAQMLSEQAQEMNSISYAITAGKKELFLWHRYDDKYYATNSNVLYNTFLFLIGGASTSVGIGGIFGTLALTSTMIAQEFGATGNSSLSNQKPSESPENTAILAAMLLLAIMTLIYTIYTFSKKHKDSNNTADKVVFYNHGKDDEKSQPQIIRLTKEQYLAQQDPQKLNAKLHIPNKVSCVKKASIVTASFLFATNLFAALHSDENSSQIKDTLSKEVAQDAGLPIGVILATGLLLTLALIYANYKINERKISAKVKEFETQAQATISR